jgi:DNA-binding response OmpR family regulator
MLDENTGLFYIDNKIINLSWLESDILASIISHKPKVATFNDILKDVWNEKELNATTRARICTGIVRLKKALKDYIVIKHIRNLGYYVEMR